MLGLGASHCLLRLGRFVRRILRLFCRVFPGFSPGLTRLDSTTILPSSDDPSEDLAFGPWLSFFAERFGLFVSEPFFSSLPLSSSSPPPPNSISTSSSTRDSTSSATQLQKQEHPVFRQRKARTIKLCLMGWGGILSGYRFFHSSSRAVSFCRAICSFRQ